MSHNKLIITGFLLLVLSFLFASTMFESPRKEQGNDLKIRESSVKTEPPNVIMIVAEDHSAQLGSYGDKYVRTPTLDHLAAEGVRFENAYVTQAGCSPSRASILTGLYPHQHGQIGLATHKMRMFDENIPNLPSLLAANGYRTGNIGKIHVNPESAFHFDYHQNKSYNRFGTRDVRAVANEVEGFISSDDQPFYLQANFSDAHLPFLSQQYGLPEKPYQAEDVGPLPFVGLNSTETLEQVADYYSCITRLDDGVGLLFDVLEKTGELENTLVIYLSDHGAPMPRGKMTSYEGGVHIPLIMWMPEEIESGLVRDELVSTVDLMPTILDFADVKVPDGLTGQSLRPLLEGENPPWREYLFTEFTLHWPETFFPQRTVRDERYKLILNMLPDTLNPIYDHYMTDETESIRRSGNNPFTNFDSQQQEAYSLWKNPPSIELYDLQNDRWEWNNLAGRPEYEDIQARLLSVLKDWQERTGDELRDPEKLDKLKKEVASTFIDGEYVHLRNRPEFTWQYINYLQPNDMKNSKSKNDNY